MNPTEAIDAIMKENESLREKVRELEKENGDLKDPVYCPICGSCGEPMCCGNQRCLYPSNGEEDLRHENKYLQDRITKLEGALKAQMKIRSIAKPEKLDEALTWRQNDELADRLAKQALEDK